MELTLRNILCHCLELAQLAGAEIQHIVNSNANLNLVQKGDLTPQTIADRLAEHVIVQGLRDIWPKICIIGEESSAEGDKNLIPANLERCKVENTFSANHFKELLKNHSNTLLDGVFSLDNLVIYVDPLDGTKSFVAGEYQFVTTLIGICVDGQPVAGVINFPFENRAIFGWYCKDEKHNSRVWSWRKNTSDALDQIQKDPKTLSKHLIVSSSRSRGTVSSTAQRLIDLGIADEVSRASGSGYKFSRVIENTCGFYVFPISGTCRWDTCPGTALIRALGGEVLDKYGQAIPYDASSSYENLNGFVVSSDAQLCLDIITKVTAALEYTRQVETSLQLLSPDITKILNEPRTCKSFESLSFPSHQQHCTGVVLRVHLEDDPNHPLKNHIDMFYKRVVASDLPSKDLAKWRVSMASYVNESKIYENLSDTKCTVIPSLFSMHALHEHFKNFRSADDVMKLKDTDVEELKNCLRIGYFMESLSDAYEQKEFLNIDDLTYCFDALRQFHRHAEDPTFAWALGTYWTLEKRLESETSVLAKTWDRFVEQMHSEIPMVKTEYASIGKLLGTHRLSVLSELKAAPKRVLLHGDLKSANIFFSKKNPIVKFIDFQWSGQGCATCDIVYLLLSSAELHLVEAFWTGESMFEGDTPLDRMLLDYASWLGYSEATFVRHMALSMVQYACVVVGYQWKSAPPKYFEAGRGNLGRCSHNKSYSHCIELLRLVKKSLSYLNLK